METKRYHTVLIDADHTLLDYDADEKRAFFSLYKKFGVELSSEQVETCHRISVDTWTEEGLYDVFSPRIQKEYHKLNKTHLFKMFDRIFALYPLPVSVKKCVKLFLKLLEEKSIENAGALSTVRALSKRSGGAYRVIVITNGLKKMQMGRLRAFLPYLDGVCVSEEIGAIKPQREFFERVCKKKKVEKDGALVVGDSVKSDVFGANAFGIDSCLITFLGERRVDGESGKSGLERPTYAVNGFDELKKLLL